MIISDRIFERIKELKITQKEFAKKTGIAQSTISEWKSKRTNPTAEKIMIICQVLQVSPEWLLSGVEKEGSRGNTLDWYVIDRGSETGILIQKYNDLNISQKNRLLGYLEALTDMQKSK